MDKKCTQCHQRKPFSAFNKNRCTTDGYDSVCKECRRRYYRARHPSARKTSIEEYTMQEILDEIRRRQEQASNS